MASSANAFFLTGFPAFASDFLNVFLCSFQGARAIIVRAIRNQNRELRRLPRSLSSSLEGSANPQNDTELRFYQSDCRHILMFPWAFASYFIGLTVFRPAVIQMRFSFATDFCLSPSSSARPKDLNPIFHRVHFSLERR